MRKLLWLFLLTGAAATAQKNFTIQEATYGQYQNYAVKSLVAQQWRPDTHTVTYIDATYENLVARNEEGKWAESTLLSKADLVSALKSKLPNETFSFRTFPMGYSWSDINTLQFEAAGTNNTYIVLLNVTDKTVKSAVAIGADAANQVLSSNGTSAAWLKENNIVITKNGKDIAVTNDSDKGIVNGSDYTHRQEFGIDKGMWWSPNSDKLLYYRKDETMVADFPLVQWSERIAAAKDIKYPMAGMKSEEVTLVIYDVANNKKVILKTDGPKEQFLTCVTWSPDGKQIYVGVLNREQNHLKLNKYDAATGNFIKTLFEEKAATYVEPLHILTFVPGNNNQFLYRTEKNGYEQLYLYNTDGKELKKLGYKDVVVTELLGFDTGAKNVFYIGAVNNGLDRQLYKTDLKSGKTVQVTTASGTHSAIVSTDGSLVLDSFSNTTTPNDVSIVNTKTNKATTLFKAENPYTNKTILPKMELVTVTSADGKTPLNGRLIYPANFDAAKKYPVMVYVYGGPHAQLVTNKWLGGAGLFDYYMAQQGYVVFTIDNRGSDARGRDFEHVVHRNLGVNEMADQMQGVAFLKGKSFVDASKIGVYGWSFGGFMTTSLMLDQADTFKVGVAGGPVCDWKYYEVMYGERYMDTPQENPEGYESTSVIKKAPKLKGRLLVIHGAQDNVVVQQNSMEFINACIANGKQVDYFLYPTHEHNVRGKDRVHLNQKIADYFDTYLKK
ncbi:prolyl oligopeptidase family serine peptidase [Flavobacterium zepuense]|uniref:Prolyl oligopeptidase family serine peptidase n=1 Tax=Flavobacterium zepuense TaxID=2593302 RepID=A0A552V1N5_9FLAO|nr:DPP IV N-terminal domain-containing protein [Flavobacterium zepuense]TRW24358.1 prolyl oligopeptidase family serine peptidase [Flavobacterium zepuense]